MANRYLRATGNWDGPVWAATSGGAAGSAATPTASDDVYISDSYSLTINVNASCSTFLHNNGSVTVNSGVTLSIAGGSFQTNGNNTRAFTNNGTVEVNNMGDFGSVAIVGSNLTFTNNGLFKLGVVGATIFPPTLQQSTNTSPLGDFSILMGVTGAGTQLNINGSPTFRLLSIVSANSAAHTVNFDVGATIDVTKFVAVGSSSANRLTLKNSPNNSPDTQIRFAEGGSSYGQYVNAYVEPGPYPDYGGVPLYIGSNSSQDTVWLLQDPPKISTIVDPLTTTPGSNPNWTYINTPTAVTTGTGGGGYQFLINDSTPGKITSTDTFDMVDSQIVLELFDNGVGDSSVAAYIGDTYSGPGDAWYWAGDTFSGAVAVRGVGATTSSIYKYRGSLIDSTSTSDQRYIRMSVSSSEKTITVEQSSDGVSWSNGVTGSVTDLDLLLLRSVRIKVSGYDGEYDTRFTIGSINPSFVPRTPVEVPGIGGGFGVASGYAGTGYGESMRLASVEEEIALDNAIHSLSSDNIALSQAHLTAAANALHAHTASSPAMTQNHVISVDSTSSSLTSGELSLVEDYALQVQQALHSVFSDGIALSVAGYLGVQNALHGIFSTEPALAQAHRLAVSSGSIDHKVSSVSLVQHFLLSVGNALHTLYSGNLQLTGEAFLAVQKAFHTLLSPQLTVQQLHSLLVDSASSGLSSDIVSLIEAKILALNSAIHALKSPQVFVSQATTLGVQNASSTVSSQQLALLELQLLDIKDSLHGLSSEAVALLEYTLLNKPHDSTHTLSSELVNIGQNFVLSVKDGLILISSKNLEKIVDLTKLGIELGRYRPDYKQPGAIELGSIDTGRIREGYGDHGLIETIDPITSGRYREDYKETGKY